MFRRGRGGSKAMYDQTEKDLEFYGCLIFLTSSQMPARGSIARKRIEDWILFLRSGIEAPGCYYHAPHNKERRQKKTQTRTTRQSPGCRSVEHSPSFHYRFMNPQRHFFSLSWAEAS